MSALPFDPVASIIGAIRRDPNIAPAVRQALKPQSIRIRVGWTNPRDDSVIDWMPPDYMGRKAAADTIRAARRLELKVEKSVQGYSVSGLSPVWRYGPGPQEMI